VAEAAGIAEALAIDKEFVRFAVADGDGPAGGAP